MKVHYPYSAQCYMRGGTLWRKLRYLNIVLGDYASRAQLETAYFTHKKRMKEREIEKAHEQKA